MISLSIYLFTLQIIIDTIQLTSVYSGVQHSVIMADFIKHERQQLIILIIYSPDLSKDLVEL